MSLKRRLDSFFISRQQSCFLVILLLSLNYTDQVNPHFSSTKLLLRGEGEVTSALESKVEDLTGRQRSSLTAVTRGNAGNNWEGCNVKPAGVCEHGVSLPVVIHQRIGECTAVR